MPTLFEELAVGFADAGVRRAAVVASVHNLQFLEALDAAGVSIVAARSEIGAAYLADGHARIAREPTLVVTSTGPGAGNAVGAYSVAAKDGAAVVHVSTANDRRPAHALHDVPEQVEWMRAMGRGVHDVARTGIASLRSALAAREWPFAVIVPSEDRPGDAEDTGGRAGESPERASRVGGIDTEMLRPWLDASRRALWIGGGARGVDRARLVELAEASGAAVLTSVQGKDLFPAHHPQFVTCTLSDRELAEIAAEADVCLVLGSRLTELSCTGWVRPFPRRVIRVGYTDEVPAFEATETTILRADASDVVDALLEAFGAGRAARSEHGVAAGRSAAAACAGRDRGNLEHRYVDAIRNALEPGDTVVCDMTKLSFWTLGGLALPEGVRYLFPGLLSMGFGLPAALGASLAAPDSHVVAVIGDGSLASILSEFDLAAGWQGRVSIVLSDDNGYGILRPSMNDEVGPVVCEFAGPRWDVLADACGAAYHEATDPDVLASVLAQRHTGVRIAHIDATDVGLGWRRATR